MQLFYVCAFFLFYSFFDKSLLLLFLRFVLFPVLVFQSYYWFFLLIYIDQWKYNYIFKRYSNSDQTIYVFFLFIFFLLFSNWLFFCCYHRYAARINKNQHLLYSILNLFLSFGIIFLYFIYLISLVFVSVARTHNMIN